MLRVFISYSSRDRSDALRLKEIAESAGHSAWMDVFDIRPAARLQRELEEGVSSADVLCLLLSPSAVASPWVRDELAYALAAERKGLRVLPVILKATPIPDELADRVALDARRGLDDPSVALRVTRALGGHVEDAALLDAVRRAELADRATIEAAEGALPGLRERLERVIDEPIRSLSVSVDQDTWPRPGSGVIEIGLTIDMFRGALSILLAPYVEGRTWRAGAGIEERPPGDFFGSTKPRVDARLLWAGRSLTATQVHDGTDLGEAPLRFPFELAGDEFTGEERARTMVLLDRFELPSLRGLIDRGSTIAVWMHPPGDGEPQRVDPGQTDLGLRVDVPLRREEAGIFGFRLWGERDRTDAVLLQSPMLRGMASDLEREALLSLYRTVPLRAEQQSAERRNRIAAALASGEGVEPEDRWAAFAMAANRAAVPRLRGQRREAAQHVHDALRILGEVDPADLDGPRAFRLLGALTDLVGDLASAAGSPQAVEYYSDAVVDLGRRLCELHPDEPDYPRALARNLLQRARLHPGPPAAVDDVGAAVAAIERLVQEEAMPWRHEEVEAVRREAAAVLNHPG